MSYSWRSATKDTRRDLASGIKGLQRALLPRATSCTMISTTAVVLPVPTTHAHGFHQHKHPHQDAALDTTLQSLRQAGSRLYSTRRHARHALLSSLNLTNWQH